MPVISLAGCLIALMLQDFWDSWKDKLEAWKNWKWSDYKDEDEVRIFTVKGQNSCFLVNISIFAFSLMSFKTFKLSLFNQWSSSYISVDVFWSLHVDFYCADSSTLWSPSLSVPTYLYLFYIRNILPLALCRR